MTEKQILIIMELNAERSEKKRRQFVFGKRETCRQVPSENSEGRFYVAKSRLCPYCLSFLLLLTGRKGI